MTRTLLVLAVATAALPAAAQELKVGDAARGEALFRLECSACHGADGRGDPSFAPIARVRMAPLPDLRDSAFLAQRSDGQLRSAVRDGRSLNGPIKGHGFKSFTSLELWDIVQYLRDGVLDVPSFFPDAVKFTAKAFTIDQYGLDRLKQTLKIELTPAEADVMVITVYGGERAKNEKLKLVKWTPVELDLLKAKDRLGFLVFSDVSVPGGDKVPAGFAFDTSGKLLKVRVQHADPKKRAEIEAALNGFAGQGEKKPVAFKAPRGVKGGDKWAPVVTRVASRVAEGITMFDKFERDRTAFDR